MRLKVLVLLVLLVTSAWAHAQYDNVNGTYRLEAMPSAASEALRMNRTELCDEYPAGRYVARGEKLVITVEGLPDGFSLDVTIGFRPMWGVEIDKQEESLVEGENTVTASQAGPLFLRFLQPDGDSEEAEVSVEVEGGVPLPLYVDGQSSASQWHQQLKDYARAPFVQLLGEHAIITLPRHAHIKSPVKDPRATFATINRMIDLQDELAGLDGSTERDQRSKLRQHYLVDFRVSKAELGDVYMYATDQFIGMREDNTFTLTDPKALRREWGIWHETGHTHQQNAWTWDALTEVNVNLFSLYVQEAFGQPSTLQEQSDEDGTYLEQARSCVEQGTMDPFIDPENERCGYFVRLVMFYQLKEAFGWDLFKDLHKHFRANPSPEDASDQDKADALVQALCELTGVDLRAFFSAWGIEVSDTAAEALDEANFPPPDEDYSQNFE